MDALLDLDGVACFIYSELSLFEEGFCLFFENGNFCTARAVQSFWRDVTYRQAGCLPFTFHLLCIMHRKKTLRMLCGRSSAF